MPDDYKDSIIKYRLERAAECIEDAKRNLNESSLFNAANRLYYGVFNTMRSLLADDGIDFKKHSGVISYFRANYIKTGVFDGKFSELVRQASSIRNECDYADLYEPDKEQITEQIELAEEFYKIVSDYLQHSKI